MSLVDLQSGKIIKEGASVGRSTSSNFGFNSPETLVKIGGSDDRACPLTVYLGIKSPMANVDATINFAFARIRWGTGGYQHEADIDFLNGTQFTIFGSSVEVIAFVEQDTGTSPPVLGATVSYGARPGGGPVMAPQRTERITSVAASATVISVIPRYAQNVIVERVDSAGVPSIDNFRLEWNELGGAFGAGFRAGALDVPTGVQMDAWAVPRTAKELVIINGAFAIGTLFSVIYKLAL